MNCVIMARVSSEDQEDGLSLDAQIENMRRYCAMKGLNIVREFKFVESSTRGKRKQFHDMLSFVISSPGKMAIVVDCVDRLQRGFSESPKLDELRQTDKIEIHFLRENLVISKDSDSNDIFNWEIHVLMAKKYVTTLSDNVKRSRKYSIAHGRWNHKAPIGYLNQRDEQGRAQTIIDPDRAHIVIHLFELYSTGRYSFGEIARISKGMGLVSTQNKIPLSKTTVQNMLKNPFYYGVMVVKGQKIPHVYPRLIPEQLFDRCQAVMNNKTSGRQKYAEKMFAFRGILRCSQCGNTISSDEKTKPDGRTYTYLRCVHHKNGCTQPQVNEKVILKQAKREIFDRLVLPEPMIAEILKSLRTTAQAENEFVTQNIGALHRELERLQERKGRLLDLMLDGCITQDEYTNKLNELNEKAHTTTVRINAHNKADESFVHTVESLLTLMSHAGELFESSNNEQKRALLKLVCSNCVLDDKKIRFSLEKPFDVLVNLHNRKTWLGQLDSNQH